MQSRRPLWLILAPVIFLLLWAGGYAVAKIGLQYSPPLTLLVLRYSLVIAIMGVLFLVLRPPLPKTRADWAHLAIVGFFMQTLYFGMIYIAFMNGIAAGTAALLMSLQPILVALIAPTWNNEKTSWRQWFGLFLALAGTATVIIVRSEIDAPSMLGFFYAALGLAGIVLATLWENRFGLTHHPVTANLIGYAAGLLGILPFMLALESGQVDWTWNFAGALAYLVVGNSVIAVGLLLAMIREGEVSKVSTLLFLVPPLAALIAWALLGELMPPLAWVGLGLAGFGVFIATRKW
ncbi:MAG: DMT family transporter [Rhodospirillales bacterium]|nr:DMT family transporter [Rhodospirillales bacterium]